jgi:hypothetical protein
MKNKRRLSLLPGIPETYLDLSTVVAVKHEIHAETPMVILHTSEGFAVALFAENGNSAQLMADVLSMVKSLK